MIIFVLGKYEFILQNYYYCFRKYIQTKLSGCIEKKGKYYNDITKTKISYLWKYLVCMYQHSQHEYKILCIVLTQDSKIILAFGFTGLRLAVELISQLKYQTSIKFRKLCLLPV